MDSGVTLQGIYDREHYTSEWFMQDNSYQGSGSDFLRIEKDLTTSLMVKIKMSRIRLDVLLLCGVVVYELLSGRAITTGWLAIRCARVFFVAP